MLEVNFLPFTALFARAMTESDSFSEEFGDLRPHLCT